jgi:glycerophosphoryl diester phosphodiesterase
MFHPTKFEVQGHRGARGLRPESTLAGFECAFDLGVSSIETDVHLTRDGVLVLHHDPMIRDSAGTPLYVSQLKLADMRACPLLGPDPAFPDQRAEVGTLAQQFAEARGLDPVGIATVADLLAFAAEYAECGAGKSPAQQDRSRQTILDLELKRVPFHPEFTGRPFDGRSASDVELRVVEEVQKAGMAERVRIRSFDHRSVRAVRALEPRLQTALLLSHTAPVRPGDLLAAASADLYCPGYLFVDAEVVDQVHTAGKRIVPWTVNEPFAWDRLVQWGVDGITTDYPDQLLKWLSDRGVPVL